MTAAEALATPLIQTKLEAPVSRELVPRRELLELLTEGAPRKLALIRAPAGWGKTTLLAEWHACERQERPIAWLALDRADNDPARFWAYVIEALRTVAPDVGANSLALLLAPGVSLREEMLPVLINELAALPGEMRLVLDDYHLIRTREIHDGMSFLTERLPPALRLVVASRTEPPLPLARLRGRGELIEIDASQLRFSEAEAETLVNDVHGLRLDPEDVARLRERTEGWAAGLYLAVLSLSGRENAHAFIEAFAGNDRHVVDYLSSEVLSEQPKSERAFLLRTSILERLCGPLCDAVRGASDSTELLVRIERSNYFLIPLDTRREWYRYHHLFREVLRHELQLTEPELVPALHKRAAAWLLEAGFVSDAIHHAAAGGDLGKASDLAVEHWLALVNSGSRRTVESWLAALGDEVIRADARLCLAAAWTAFSAGRLEEVLPWTEAAERAPLPAPIRDGTTSVASGAATLRTSYYLLIGDFGRARDCGREAMRLEQCPPWYAVAGNCAGAAAYWLGDTQEAVERLEETVRLGRSGMPVVVIFALSHLALFAADRSEWDEVERLVEEAGSLIEQCAADEYWAAGACCLARGRLLERRGRLEEAEAELVRGLELGRRGSGPVEVAYGLLALSGVRHALGHRAGARALVSEARQMVARCPDPGPVITQLLERAERRARLAPRGHGLATVGSDELSERERALVRLLATELTQREIGAELYVSLNTVKTHTRSIFRKLGASNRRDAVERARQLGYL